jgi:Domain of unknown function (DUF4158)
LTTSSSTSRSTTANETCCATSRAQHGSGSKGRFPRGRFEPPDDAIEHLARQVNVPATEIAAYDFQGRQIKNHRREIRNHSGYRICSVTDAEALAGWLATHIAQDERRVEHVRVLLLGHCKEQRIEPPTPERVARIVDPEFTRPTRCSSLPSLLA